MVGGHYGFREGLWVKNSVYLDMWSDVVRHVGRNSGGLENIDF